MPLVLKLSESDLKFLTEQVLGVIGTVTENVVHAEYLRLVLVDHAGVRSHRHLAGSECIEGVDGLVRRHVVRKVDQDVGCSTGEVIDLLDLDLTAFLGLHDGFLDGICSLSEWYFGD